MLEPGHAPVGIEFLQSEGEELGARVAELEASVELRRAEAGSLGCSADRQHRLRQALLDITVLQDESVLHRRIEEWAARLLGASTGNLILSESGP